MPDAQRKKIEKNTDKPAEEERQTVVFQFMDTNHPSHVPLFQQPRIEAKGQAGVIRPGRVNAAGQIIVDKDDEYYEPSIAGMRKAVRKKGWNVVEKTEKDIMRVPKELEPKKTAAEQVQALKLAEIEKDNLIDKLEKSQGGKDAEVAELRAEVAALKAQKK